MLRIIEEVKKYNWGKLLSDLIVAMLATGMAFLLDRLKVLDATTVSEIGSGTMAVALNWGKRMFTFCA